MEKYRKNFKQSNIDLSSRMSEKTPAINSVAVLMICNLMSRLTGFVRDMVMSYKYGTSDTSDVYYLATNVVTVVFFAISAAISMAYLPVYSKASAESAKKAKQFHNTLFTVSLCVSAVFSVLIYVFGREVTWLFAGSFEGEKFDTTVKFIQIMALSMLFSCFAQLIGSYLQYQNRFFFAAISGGILNLGYIVGVVLSDIYSKTMLAYSFLAAHVLVAVLLYIYAGKYDFTMKFSLNDRSGYMKQAWVLIVPIIFGNIAGQFSEAIDKSMASGLSTGSVSSLNYANKLQVFSIGVFVSSIVTVSFPKLSKEYSSGNTEKTRTHLKTTILSIAALSVPIMFGLIVLSSDIVTLIFGRGEFDARSAIMTSGALTIYAMGLPGTALREFFMRALFAMEDTKGPIIMDIIGLGINVVLNYIFIGSMGHLGLALGSSLANIMKSIMMFYLICRKVKGLVKRDFLLEFVKIMISSMVMLLVLVLVHGGLKKIWYVGVSRLFAVFTVSVGVSVLVYAVMLYIMGSELFMRMVRWGLGRFGVGDYGV